MNKKVLFGLIIVLFLDSLFFILPQRTDSQEMPPVVINELMWMGSHLSYSDEWIELKNITDQEIDLSGWYLTKKSSGEEKLMLAIPSGKTIAADDFFLIANFNSDSSKSVLGIEPDLIESDVSLTNTALEIKLYDVKGNLIDVADDGSGRPLAGEYESGSEWKSMERNTRIEAGNLASSWHTAQIAKGFKKGMPEFGTPSEENSNSAPVPEAGEDQSVYVGDKVYFDASDSFDPEGDDLSYSWDFGDGEKGQGPTPSHIYLKEGNYLVILTLNDGFNEVTDSLEVKVERKKEFNFSVLPEANKEEAEGNNKSKEDKEEESEVSYDFSDKILFNEIFPNPEGADKNFEFIELINLEDKEVNLFGWKVYNGRNYYCLPEDSRIKSDDFLVLKYKDLGMYLKNSGMTLYLVDPAGKIINGVEYNQVKEGQSFSRRPETNMWVWTMSVTEGEENEVVELMANLKAGHEEAKKEDIEDIKELSILSAKKLNKGDEVKVRGFVSVPPGIFSELYFYLFDGQAGIKIYSSKKSFPSLKLGDYIEVFGRISEASGEKKINISKKDNIKVLKAKDFPEAIKISLAKIDKNSAGDLVFINGEVLDLGNSKFLLGNEEGEIEIYFKKKIGFKKSDFEEGEKVEIVGILVPGSDGFRILPRSQGDIRVIGIPGEAENNRDDKDNKGTVLGASTKNEISVAGNNKRKEIIKYLLVILGGLILVSMGLLIKWRQEKAG